MSNKSTNEIIGGVSTAQHQQDFHKVVGVGLKTAIVLAAILVIMAATLL